MSGLLINSETYDGTDQRDEGFWNCPFECVWVVSGYLTPFVKVEQLGGRSNDWMGEMNLVTLGKKEWRARTGFRGITNRTGSDVVEIRTISDPCGYGSFDR